MTSRDDVPADAVEAVKALRFRTMLHGRGNPDSEELHHTPAGAREVVEALRAIGWGPADTHERDDLESQVGELLTDIDHVLGRLTAPCPQCHTLGDDPTCPTVIHHLPVLARTDIRILRDRIKTRLRVSGVGQQKGGNAGEAEEPDVVNPGPASDPCPHTYREHGTAEEAGGGSWCLACGQFIKDQP